MQESGDGTTFWTEEAEPSVRIIGMRGELDAATVESFRSHVKAALADGRDVVVDFTELVYFDSVGLTAVIEAWQLAGTRGLGLALVVGDLVKSKFHLRGVESFLPLVADRDAAFARLAEPPSAG